MANQNETSQTGNSRVLSSIRASVGALALSGEPGQREKTWKLWKARFERVVRWMSVYNEDKLDRLLLVGGEEVQKTMETLPEQATDFQSYMDRLDSDFQAHRNIILEVCKSFNVQWPPGMYFSDLETAWKQQGIHCDFPINRTVVETRP